MKNCLAYYISAAAVNAKSNNDIGTKLLKWFLASFASLDSLHGSGLCQKINTYVSKWKYKQ